MHNSFDVGNELPRLEGSRVALRWLTGADVEALYAVFSDANVCRYWSALPWTDRVQSWQYLEEIRRLFAARTLFQWGIVRREDDGVIGTCTLAHLDESNRRAEIGFALSSGHWGNGYMREAATLTIDYAFGGLGLHRIEADVDPRNERSITLLESLGFRREGYLRERHRLGDEVQDALFYGLLQPEWNGG